MMTTPGDVTGGGRPLAAPAEFMFATQIVAAEILKVNK